MPKDTSLSRERLHGILKRIFRYMRWAAAGALDVYVALMYRGLKTGRSDEWTMFKFLFVVAAFDTLVVVFEAWNESFDEAEKKAMRDEIGEAKNLAHDVKSRLPRQITDEGVEALKKAVEKYPRPRIQIIGEDDRNGEVAEFAKNVSRAFNQCGWTNSPSVMRLSAGTSLWICSSPKAGDTNWATEIIRDITTVLKDDGIVVVERSERIDRNPMPEGCIEINIGPRWRD